MIPEATLGAVQEIHQRDDKKPTAPAYGFGQNGTLWNVHEPGYRCSGQAEHLDQRANAESVVFRQRHQNPRPVAISQTFDHA
ncbi:hypothetical protein [Desulfonatronum thioautotrophicum]|uniref:hypothetical protein n=1 Tax=Desulfonatronum thioautotrophicum TaxID=617001 RepID=UPI0012947697|nr:hypothetical protein [Desulfonatronum thioautotrophicum]